LAVFLRQQGHELPPAQALKALVSDLAAEQDHLVVPLQNLVQTPAFRQLVPKAGSGDGFLERQALLQSLQNIYAPAMVNALGAVLSGFLDLPASLSHNESISAIDFNQRPNDLSGVDRQSLEQHDIPLKNNTDFQVAASAVSPSAATHSNGRTLLFIFLGSAACLLGLGVIAIAPMTPLCKPLKNCIEQQKAQDDIDTTIAAGSLAQQSLDQADDLESYERLVTRLEAVLSRMNGLKLSTQQHIIRQRLQELANRANQVIAAEKLDHDRLLRAERAIDSARNLNGKVRELWLGAASLELEQIAPTGFTASRAQKLRRQLDSLVDDPPKSLNTTSLDPSAPNGYPPRRSISDTGFPWRDQPLWFTGSPWRDKPLW